MDESFITPELEAAVGREGTPCMVTLTPELLRRVRETLGDDANADSVPPYVLLVAETGATIPETPAAAQSLVTGDDWTFHRRPHTNERLSASARLASVQERFGSRFGHSLVLRSECTVTGDDGTEVATTGRTMIRYRTPEATGGSGGEDRSEGDAPAPAPAAEVLVAAPEQAEPLTGALSEGDALPPLLVRPTIDLVVRYCGLVWNYTPIFYDPEAARVAGLPGTLVPGPLKLALMTRYLTMVAGPGGAVRSVRCAYRRPDVTGAPLIARGVVTRVTREDGGQLVDCELWTENIRGERSVAGSATLLLNS